MGQPRGTERRRILRLSVKKLRKMEDPESGLRRAVLINNTLLFLRKGEKSESEQQAQPTQQERQVVPQLHEEEEDEVLAPSSEYHTSLEQALPGGGAKPCWAWGEEGGRLVQEEERLQCTGEERLQCAEERLKGAEERLQGAEEERRCAEEERLQCEEKQETDKLTASYVSLAPSCHSQFSFSPSLSPSCYSPNFHGLQLSRLVCSMES